MKITKQVAGKRVDVPVEEVWDSICRILRHAMLITRRGEAEEKYLQTRLSFLEERLNDIKGLAFHYRRSPHKSIVEDVIMDNRGYLVWSLYTNGITHLRGVYTEEKKGQAYVAAADTKHEAQTVRSWVEEIELNSFFCELPNRPERKPNGL